MTPAATPTTPTFVEVAYRDIVPYKHAIWCSVAGGEPFRNIVMSVRMLADGRVSLGLDSHNFMLGAPDEPVPCVVDRTERLSAFERQRVETWRGPSRVDAGPFDE